MANGTPYRAADLSAATPYAALGSILLLTSRTGRALRVPVTDRCNCSLDLSLAAFKALGLNVTAGWAWVEARRVR